MTTRKLSDDSYSAEEAQRRVEAALRAAFNAPLRPQSEMKLGKTKRKKHTSKRASKKRG